MRLAPTGLHHIRVMEKLEYLKLEHLPGIVYGLWEKINICLTFAIFNYPNERSAYWLNENVKNLSAVG